MSLYTVTFEDSDDPHDNIEPVPIDVKISPPHPSNAAHGGFRRRRLGREPEDKPTRVTKERVDVNAVNTRNIRKKRTVEENHEPIVQEEEQEEKPKRIRIKRKRQHPTQEETHPEEEAHNEIQQEKEQSDHEEKDESEHEEVKPIKQEQKTTVSEKKEEKINDDVFDEEEEIARLVKNLNEQIYTPADNNLTMYRFEIDNKITIRGKRIHFQLTKSGSPLFHAKTKSRTGTEEIQISKGTESHFSGDNFEGVILIGNDNKSFSLRRHDRYAKDVCTIIFAFHESEKKPRMMSLYNFESENGIPKELFTRPYIAVDGKWMIRVKNRSATSSIKNCVIVDTQDKEWIIVLKKEDNVLSIEASPLFDPLVVFAVGIASYLCK
ncbi:hypothetical protein TVAG_478820 [Trichomonas vaginalis G3]|uniref:Tubby C-terminal domain-containing protein n=1 Tax=Trichomonas vaginalis (strain ATCC PRA-98 / G3) TaxID=412133 RepID=A2DZZ8_TRIV3|nr:hypothetical protein TVAGG3_0536030 [Trichomonas vaginalis G3]EAY14057.1 hypothetical protein TVAG_478820 [Trichomonas vaginalis G3]KAI5519501.1 hypothetical protein TVAGG3_0536030 [Trichomonas vaginalis G3]|eukprot:XP_001326280.1 hypothetical protein [Trichomonas vaginalis G3]